MFLRKIRFCSSRRCFVRQAVSRYWYVLCDLIQIRFNVCKSVGIYGSYSSECLPEFDIELSKTFDRDLLTFVPPNVLKAFLESVSMPRRCFSVPDPLPEL